MRIKCHIKREENDVDTWCARGVLKRVTGLGQEGQCPSGFLQGRAGYSDANDCLLGITRILAIMLTAVGMSANSHMILTFVEKIKIDAFGNLCNTEQNSKVSQCS